MQGPVSREIQPDYGLCGNHRQDSIYPDDLLLSRTEPYRRTIHDPYRIGVRAASRRDAEQTGRYATSGQWTYWRLIQAGKYHLLGLHKIERSSETASTRRRNKTKSEVTPSGGANNRENPVPN